MHFNLKVIAKIEIVGHLFTFDNKEPVMKTVAPPPVVVKSRYKLVCPTCESTIHPGDLITPTVSGCGMDLRPRLLNNSPSWLNGCTYIPNTGCDHVHRDCTMKMDAYTRYTFDEDDLSDADSECS